MIPSNQEDNNTNSISSSSTNNGISLVYPMDTPLDSILEPIDDIIRNLGDNAHCCKKRKRNDDNDGFCPLVGLERQYHELYRLLARGLLNNNDHNHTKRNVSALLMGPRGHGKTLLLETCLSSLQEGNDDNNKFRVVRLNGLFIKGHDVTLAVREILRQLSEIATMEASQLIHNNNNNNNDSNYIMNSSSDKTTKTKQQQEILSREDEKKNDKHKTHWKFQDLYLLRTRQTSFISSLSLLDEVFRLANVDGIPILIVLDEIDSFMSSSTSTTTTTTNATTNNTTATRRNHPFKNHNNKKSHTTTTTTTTATADKQLLLYHLLDRVADHGSLLSLVGMTPRLSTVGMFEKRVKSRAEGTSTVIYVGHPPTFDALANIFISKFEDPQTISTHSIHQSLWNQLQADIKYVLSPNNNNNSNNKDQKRYNHYEEIYHLLQRNYAQGKDIRWFSRVFTTALALLSQDMERQFQHQQEKNHPTTKTKTKIEFPNIFLPKYIMEGLMIMKGIPLEKSVFAKTQIIKSVVSNKNNSSDNNNNNNDTNNGDENNDISLLKYILSDTTTTTTTVGSNKDSCYYYGPFDREDGKPCQMNLGYDSRIHALLDMPGSQVAIVVAARRILLRDKDKNDDCFIPLTMERILMEYETSFLMKNKSMGPDRFSNDILVQAFLELLETDILRPATDHSGAGIFQYSYSQTKHTIGNNNITKCPLHFNIHLDSELGELLKHGMLDCTTSMRDWGLTTY